MSDTIQPDELGQPDERWQPGEQSLDHNWLAFRYVQNELPADEIAEFEYLLADSQAAREAVAAAVLLSQAVELAGSVQPARGATENPASLSERSPQSVFERIPQWRVRLTWGLVGAAASLLLAWSLQSWRDTARSVHPGAGARQSDHEDLNKLAIQWSTARSYDLKFGDDTANASQEWSDITVDGAGISVALADDVSDDVSAPAWLLDAVSADNQSPRKPRPDRNP